VPGTGLRKAALLAASGLVIVVSGCQTTSSSCVNERCTAKLQGSGAEVELESLDVDVTLEEADEGVASLDLDGTEVECRQGGTVETPAASITCGKIGDDEVSLRVTAP
jgi:hypothetical protein